jgi:hypothetical protein
VLARQSYPGDHADAATPDSHPDCRWLLIQIAAQHRRAGVKLHHSGMEGRPRMRGTRLISVIVNSAFQFDQ